MTGRKPAAFTLLLLLFICSVWLHPHYAQQLGNGPVTPYPENEDPGLPYSPHPENGATGVPLDLTLQWRADDTDGDTLTYNIYFGAGLMPPLLKAQYPDTSLPVTGLEPSTTYSWTIDVEDGKGGMSLGPVWKFTTGEATGINEPSATIPTSMALLQNYPNPFNPTTTIEVAVNESLDCVIAVYSLSGEVIEILFEGFLERGEHEFVWPSATTVSRSLPSGVYVYRIISNDFTAARKMLLIK